MNEKMDKRILASCLAIVALVFGVVCGTMAFLQDNTGVIENEFTYGMVDISLLETAVDEYGVAVSPAATVADGESQDYKLIPGHSYLKDPVVTVEADSEDAYVFFVVDNEVAAIEDATAGTIASQIATAGWTALAPAQGGTLYLNGTALTATQTIYYKSTTSSSSDQELATFDTLNIADNAVVSTYDGQSIDVTAYAVQSDGFATALAAWEATFGVPAAAPAPAEPELLELIVTDNRNEGKVVIQASFDNLNYPEGEMNGGMITTEPSISISGITGQASNPDANSTDFVLFLDPDSIQRATDLNGGMATITIMDPNTYEHISFDVDFSQARVIED